jgi:hypothetical protein
MKETAQQYTQRILGYLEGKDLMEVLRSTPGELEKLVKGVDRKKLDERPPADKWSVTMILAHIADTDIVQGYRIRLVLGANGIAIQGFDQDAWAAACAYPSHDPALSLSDFRVIRERTVRLLRSLSREQWSQYGMHSERGRETVQRIAEMMAGHDLNHLKQIRAILGK